MLYFVLGLILYFVLGLISYWGLFCISYLSWFCSSYFSWCCISQKGGAGNKGRVSETRHWPKRLHNKGWAFQNVWDSFCKYTNTRMILSSFQRRCWLSSLVVNTSMETRGVKEFCQSRSSNIHSICQQPHSKNLCWKWKRDEKVKSSKKPNSAFSCTASKWNSWTTNQQQHTLQHCFWQLVPLGECSSVTIPALAQILIYHFYWASII